MARPDLVAYYPIIFPNRRDSSGHQLCRWCGKPVDRAKGKRKFYCDDECYRLTYLALSWEMARRATFERDGGRCRICGREVRLGDEREPLYSERAQAEIHHVVRPVYLWRLAIEVTREIVDMKLREYWFCKVFTLLYLDVNNLMTLCQSPCHDQVHAADYRNQGWKNPFDVAPTKWGGFLHLNESFRVSRTLEEFAPKVLLRETDER